MVPLRVKLHDGTVATRLHPIFPVHEYLGSLGRIDQQLFFDITCGPGGHVALAQWWDHVKPMKWVPTVSNSVAALLGVLLSSPKM